MKNMALHSLCVALFLLRTSCADGKLVVFGDSLSDNGNLFALTERYPTGGYPPEPYGDTYGKSGKAGYDFPGRFTDGQNWVDYFSTIGNYSPAISAYWKDGGTDFAVGGSTSEDVNVNSKKLGLDLPGLPTQINAYLATLGGKSAADDLFVIWIGANDFFAEIEPAQTVANIKNAIAKLADNGARNFVVISVPDISLTPTVIATGGATTLAAKRFVYATNVLLEIELLRTAFLHRISIDVVHINAIVIPLVYNPGRFRFTNSTDAAFNLTTGAVVSDPNDYVFWDGFHPTTNAHYIAAKFIFSSVFSRLHFHEFLSGRFDSGIRESPLSR